MSDLIWAWLHLVCKIKGHKYITVFKGLKSDNVYCTRCKENFYVI